MPLQYSGWAYVSCSATSSGTATGQGPDGAVQFHTGSGGISGSANLIFNTSSSPNNLFLTGNLLVEGDITATNLDIVNHTVSYLSSSGDSKFGDTDSDLHQFTGSVAVAKAGVAMPTFLITASTVPAVGILSSDPIANFTLSGSYAINYTSIAGDYDINKTDYFVVVKPTASALLITLPSAVDAGPGRLVIVKLSGSTTITVSASAAQYIDDVTYSEIASSFASETYVSDGTSVWFRI